MGLLDNLEGYSSDAVRFSDIRAVTNSCRDIEAVSQRLNLFNTELLQEGLKDQVRNAITESLSNCRQGTIQLDFMVILEKLFTCLDNLTSIETKMSQSKAICHRPGSSADLIDIRLDNARSLQRIRQRTEAPIEWQAIELPDLQQAIRLVTTALKLFINDYRDLIKPVFDAMLLNLQSNPGCHSRPTLCKVNDHRDEIAKLSQNTVVL